jgi:tetratricopeptide (TPR) repeat protein
MQNNRYLWGAVATVLILGSYVIFHSRQTALQNNTASSTPSIATTTVDLGNGQSVTLPPGVTIETVGTTTASASSAVKAPSLNGAIKIDAKLASDVQAALRTNEQTLITQLKANPDRLDLWLKLGLYRKMAGDYAGAAEAWNYVANSQSNISYVAYGNLGNLYADFLKDYPKAEASYKAAIALKPTVIDYYRQLYYLYKGFYKINTSAAGDILRQGLKANPNNPDLLQLQNG